MPARRLTPPKNELIRMLDAGMTHGEIAEAWSKKTGETVKRSSVSVAAHRYGLTEPRHRYTEEIPWRLSGKDLRAYPVRMLRLLGRRRMGESLEIVETKRLDSWLALLQRENAVVAFDPDSSPSVFYTDREPGDDPNIPIRKQRVYLRPRYQPKMRSEGSGEA